MSLSVRRNIRSSNGFSRFAPDQNLAVVSPEVLSLAVNVVVSQTEKTPRARIDVATTGDNSYG